MISVKVTIEHIEIESSGIGTHPHLTIEFAIDELARGEHVDICNLLGLQVELNLPRRLPACSSKR